MFLNRSSEYWGYVEISQWKHYNHNLVLMSKGAYGQLVLVVKTTLNCNFIHFYFMHVYGPGLGLGDRILMSNETFCLSFYFFKENNKRTRGPRATTRSPEWNHHCRYAYGMQHFSNTFMTRQWLKQFLRYLAFKVKMLKFSKHHK